MKVKKVLVCSSRGSLELQEWIISSDKVYAIRQQNFCSLCLLQCFITIRNTTNGVYKYEYFSLVRIQKAIFEL